MFEELNGKRYNIIYADPPWKYSTNMYGKEGIDTGSADTHYPTMEHEDICGMPVSDITLDDAMCFMWAVSPKLPDSIEVGKSWGFEYNNIAFVWEKGKVNPGNYTMSLCEVCLLFTKGDFIEPTKQFSQFFSCHRGRHSEKPWQIRNMIHQMYPDKPKIELFARNLLGSTEWDFWGNQSDNMGELTIFDFGGKDGLF